MTHRGMAVRFAKAENCQFHLLDAWSRPALETRRGGSLGVTSHTSEAASTCDAPVPARFFFVALSAVECEFSLCSLPGRSVGRQEVKPDGERVPQERLLSTTEHGIGIIYAYQIRSSLPSSLCIRLARL